MVLGLKRGTAELVDHNPEWKINAADTIKNLWDILGSVAKDIQHIGSTSIRHIKAKPVIDIVAAVYNFDEVLALIPTLEKKGFFFRGWEGKEEKQPRFQCGEYSPDENDMLVLTHYVHIVLVDSQAWKNYINLRDYMNSFPGVAREYEALKLQLEKENKNDYSKYFQGKQKYILKIIEAAGNWRENKIISPGES